MIANYHTHTPRCHHAYASEEEFCQAAIDGGLKILGFSDHSPYYFPGDYYSNFRMDREQLEDYAQSVFACRDKYAHQLQVHLGVEAEFYPNEFAKTVDLLKSHGVEYMLLAMHFVHHEEGELYSGRPSDSVQRLVGYCDWAIEALKTGLFTYFAHPDMLNFTGDQKLFDKHMRRLCRAVSEMNVPLEINLLGLTEGRNYPNPRFWRIAGEEGCKAIIGCDAHKLAMLPNLENARKAENLAREWGVELLETVQLKPLG